MNRGPFDPSTALTPLFRAGTNALRSTPEQTPVFRPEAEGLTEKCSQALGKVDKRDGSAKKPLKNSVREEKALNLSTAFADLPAGRQERTTAMVLKEDSEIKKEGQISKGEEIRLRFPIPPPCS